MANMGEIGKNGKKMIKRIEEFMIPYLKSMPLQFTHHIMPEKKEKSA